MQQLQANNNLSNEELIALLKQLLSAQSTSMPAIPAITIRKGKDDMLDDKIRHGLSDDSQRGFHLTFKYLGQVIDLENELSTISQDIINNFIDLLVSRDLKKAGINRRIREMRTFVNYYKKRGYTFQRLEFELFRVGGVPSYLSEPRMKKILAEMKPEHREYINLYLSTGARLREIYNATLKSDNFLVIPAELCKTRRPIEIELTPENVIIYKRLMESGLSAERLSRLFKAACVKAGYPEHHFHQLRATAGMMEYIRTGDIFHVSRMLHHSTVKTTESHYLVHSKRRLKADFKSLQKNCIKLHNT